MNILYVGDIMGEVGIEVIEKVLPGVITEEAIDIVIAQAENVSEGKGITQKDYNRLKEIGVDFFTGGNWSLHRKESYPLFNDPREPIVRPANYPNGTPGLGFKYLNKNNRTVLVISLLGHIVGKDADKPIDNPLKVVDEILKTQKGHKKDAVIVNFHGDYSSEKVIIGHYLDGRVSAVVGDHWHVPTADARVLAKGTAHISDVGMCGALNASLGVKFDSVITRWKNNIPTKNVLEKDGKRQFNAVAVTVGGDRLAVKIKQIQKII